MILRRLTGSLLPLPRFARVWQPLDQTEVPDLSAALAASLAALGPVIHRDQQIVIGIGSRGIARLPELVSELVRQLHAAGAQVTAIPAMGSHGGATATGQRAVLEHLGITEATIGCPIHASMATRDIGGAHVNELALSADLFIPINRIKPHTGFVGPVESGLSKMLAIGLGNQVGAETAHRQGYDRFETLIPTRAQRVLAVAPIRFGIALIENGQHGLAQIVVVPAEGWIQREAVLLKDARARLPKLPVDTVDVLIVDEIGKDISGVGMDPNVTGRDHRGQRPDGPRVQRIFVRALTPTTAGHAAGIGVADIAHRRAIEAIDPHKTWVNSITAKTPENARVPIAATSDRQGLALARAMCVGDATRILRIANTSDLAVVQASETLLRDCPITARIIDPPRPLTFSESGALVSPLSPGGDPVPPAQRS